MTAQQLKASIIQLAIQGKLVPQIPEDEPASELLKRIKAEKDALVKAGKIKKEKPLPPISEDEISFDIPDSWEWVRLETVSLVIHYGFTASASNQGNAKLLRITDIQDNIVSWKDVPFCMVTQDELERYQLQNRDILIARTGGTIGKTYIVKGISGTAVFASYLIRVVPSQFVDERFLKVFMESPLYWSELKNASAGTGQPNVNGQALRMLSLPLPPLEEQKRIVAKIEELLPHVAEYGKVETALSKLNAEMPEQLKKSILQWAIQGRLVPQDPNDEPASELLKRIHAEKAALIKSGKLKKEKPLPPITEDEIPFDIPESWIWVRCGDVFQHNTGKALNSTNRTGRLLEYITTSNLYWNRFELDKLREMFFTDAEIEKCTAQKGDLLVCEGGDFGRAAIWNFDRPICIQNHIHRLRSFVSVSTKFFYYLFLFYKSAGLIGGKGIGIQGLSSNALHALVFPLPPLTEQERIVRKLESVLSNIRDL